MAESNGFSNGWTGLSNRVALITGAARGIGRAIVLEFARRGAKVAVNYRTGQTDAECLAGIVREAGAECLLLKGDVSTPEEAQRVVHAAADEWGRLDILVNNAGITRDKSLRKVADDEWADVINVNLNGTYHCTAAAVPVMIQQRYGRIINISSYLGQSGNFAHANYLASKGGIIAFTKALAMEVAKYNVTANAISPGFTATDRLSRVPPHLLEQIRTRIPLGRFGCPEEIAKAAAFLAGDADYITGQQLNVNGGMYM